MAELTPEEIKREQERLRLIQEQNEAGKELLTTYEKQKKVTGALTNDEKDIVNLTRDLNNLSTELGNSVQKRLSGTSSLKDLEGQLKKLKQENVNFEDNAVKLSQAKLQAQQKFQQLDNDRVNKANQLFELENNYEAQLARQFQKESELATLAGSRNQADRDRARELATEISQGKVQLKETQRYITAKERQVELAKAAADEQYNLVKQINKTIEANEKTKEQLAEELDLLQQAVKLKKQEEVLDVLKEKFNTKQITDLLTISGITKNKNVIADIGLHGGGWHSHTANGKLNVHLDYSIHPKLNLERHYNLIVYMTPDWNNQWGGGLELWSGDSDSPKELVKVVENKFNRAVLFDTTENSWHGLPKELNCPPGVFRQSLAVYYVSPVSESAVSRPRALFAPFGDQKNDQQVLDIINKRKTLTKIPSLD
jgi:Rps23 Pro-64 3,4-dihydroxylase Tpa1-like proline 4-hydroxylase